MSNSEFWLKVTEIIISALGFGGTICALLFGFRQYQRAEQWKRAEFIAKEIKEFESDPYVRNAMQMIDWGERKINLFQMEGLKYDDCVLVNRDKQWRALLPHTIKEEFPSLFVDSNAEKKKRFTPEETQIRDTYDVFLNYLQRFGNFVEADLIDSAELRPYLFYWLQSIAEGDLSKDEDSAGDIAWRCALLCYINFYNFNPIISLFQNLGFDISPRGIMLKQLEGKIEDKSLCVKLMGTIQPIT